MHTLTRCELELGKIDSDADFVILSEEHGVVSEHCTVSEARMAYFQEVAKFSLGEHLPTIFCREDDHWVPLS